ncbi:sigma-70 family RNA polymerase sigma factor [Streptomyces sp. MP131-18]|uniref:sigma-70 family RNA polymerase sigma factor n=1 Tax=Streptomyces sp. MP131-18 TaxID=1857892 RepID=UPI00097BA8A9|nr:sigma-70 family RNA polymerase sigma factor [Streptomyces sp. MP131-18]ONK14038.1 RNA polymerase sigma factor SigJ [Streptomyces sp. MP131-18]
MELVEYFEAARPRLMSLAHRIVGSHQDAEDAVQTAWTRVQAADLADVTNLDGWFTTVTTRLCIDLLRARERRGELPLLSDDIRSEQLSADEAFLRREEVSRALLVLLGELSPGQRAAYVLHDLFAVPFDQVAAVLDTNAVSAKKLASRARARLRNARPGESAPRAQQTQTVETAETVEIIEAFLAAARGGDITRLVTLMAPDAVRTADIRLLPAGSRTEVRGAAAIAEETRTFTERIAAAVPVLIAGRPGAVIAPGGHAYALVHFQVDAGRVTGIDIAPYTSGTVSLVSPVVADRPGAAPSPRTVK